MLQADQSGPFLPETLPAAENFIQSAMDALPAHVAMLDDSGTIISINRAWRRYAEVNGLTLRDAGLGANYLRVCDQSTGRNSQEAALVARGIREIISRHREEFYLEYPCHSPGQKNWFIVQITRFEWSGRLRLIMAHQNVTQLKEVQHQLSDHRKRLEAIFNHVVNGIVTISGGGRLKMLNPAALAIFGYNNQTELTGQSINNLFPSPHHELTSRRLLEVLQLNGNHELVGQRKDGSLFPMLFGISEMQINGRRMYTGIVQDITERKQMEAELLEKERISLALNKEREMREFKNRFISIMSHELRTPLSSILLSSDLLKHYGDRADPEEKLMYLDNISTQVEHLAALIKEMLTVSRSEKQELEYKPQPGNLSALCQQVIEEYRITHPNCILSLSQPDEPIHTLLDPRLMRQVLNNLLSNAIKYSVDAAQVEVELLIEAGEIALRVTDQGIGIPEVDLPLLFEPFHRGGNVENMPGTGLGLNIVQQAVELHGGTIEVQSHLHQGTIFTIRLPYNQG